VEDIEPEVQIALIVIAIGAATLIGMSGAFLWFGTLRLLGKELLFGSLCLIALVGMGLLWLAPELRASPETPKADVVDAEPHEND
jgi:hypothetical protein